jgi:hypothetical protein
MSALRYVAKRRFNFLDTFFFSLATALGWCWEAVGVLLVGAFVSTCVEMAVESRP